MTITKQTGFCLLLDNHNSRHVPTGKAVISDNDKVCYQAYSRVHMLPSFSSIYYQNLPDSLECIPGFSAYSNIYIQIQHDLHTFILEVSVKAHESTDAPCSTTFVWKNLSANKICPEECPEGCQAEFQNGICRGSNTAVAATSRPLLSNE